MNKGVAIAWKLEYLSAIFGIFPRDNVSIAAFSLVLIRQGLILMSFKAANMAIAQKACIALPRIDVVFTPIATAKLSQ